MLAELAACCHYQARLTSCAPLELLKSLHIASSALQSEASESQRLLLAAPPAADRAAAEEDEKALTTEK